MLAKMKQNHGIMWVDIELLSFVPAEPSISSERYSSFPEGAGKAKL
jgi:hypothetical protein